MKDFSEHLEHKERHERQTQTGYTFIEILGVTAIIIIVVLMTQGMIRNYKRYSIEEIAVQRLKELARYEHVYRHSNDPEANPEGTYGTFYDLQNAKLISDLYVQNDGKRHTVNAFVPHYRLEFRGGDEESVHPGQEVDVKMNVNHYVIKAIPLVNSRDAYKLRTFYMQEDGEVYFGRYGLWSYPR